MTRKRTILQIIGSILNYSTIWTLFVAAELTAWLVKGHCHIITFTDHSYFLDCVCYQPGYQGKC